MLFTLKDEFYTPDQVKKFLHRVRPYMPRVRKGKIWYYNCPAAFDLEASSFRMEESEEKAGCMYAWMLGICGLVMLGRTWQEYESVMAYLVENLKLDAEHRIVFYSHNLAYDWQWFRRHHDWADIMALAMREPIRACTDTGLEFRCSLKLSGMSLDKLADELRTYHVRKLTGSLDYSLIRTPETELTDAEYDYCIHDVQVVMAYIQERMDEEGGITKIPSTRTGYVRRYCRDHCFELEPGKKKCAYKRIIKALPMDLDEYNQLRAAFCGGYTHAAACKVDKDIHDVTSFDFTSSYPAVMISEEFPMSAGRLVQVSSEEELQTYLDLYCCVFDVELHGLVSKYAAPDHYLSKSKCRDIRRPTVDNGRIVKADQLSTTVTDVDWDIIKATYDYTDAYIYNMRVYRKGYLPTKLVEAVLQLYRDKTQLKGVAGKEAEYQLAKSMLNSVYLAECA